MHIYMQAQIKLVYLNTTNNLGNVIFNVLFILANKNIQFCEKKSNKRSLNPLWGKKKT